MSSKFLEKFGTKKVSKQEIRNFLKKPGKHDGDGNIQYTTEQSHLDQCDVNKIIRKYDRDGIITHVSRFEAKFGDMTGMDFKTMSDKIANAQSMFNELPVEIRNRFDNNPENLLTFMEDPENREEAIKLNIIKKEWTPETDGLGEHIKQGENVVEEQIQPELPKTNSPETG